MRKLHKIPIAFLALSLVLAACGDDDTATTTAPPTDDTAAASDTTGATQETTPPAPPSGTPGDIGALMDLYETTPLRTTYLFGEGVDREEIILAQDPTANPPVESITLVANDSKIIISEGKTIVCEAESAMCFELPGGGGDSLTTAFLGPIGPTLLAATGAAGLGLDVDTEPITVAGRSGVCFTFTPPVELGADTGTARQCVDSEFGFMLLMQVAEAGSDQLETLMELTDFRPPSDEDFAIPYPIAATPGG